MKNYYAPFQIGEFYHIYNKSVANEKLFRNHENYRFFLEKWNTYLSGYLDVYSYCLIPNHFHFLVKVNSFDNDTNQTLSSKFRQFFSSYALSYNSYFHRKGGLFERRFKRIHVDEEDYLTMLIHYIHHNPVHHRVVNHYTKYKYSSYNSIISDKRTCVKRDEILEWFGKKEKFVEYHKLNLNYKDIYKYLNSE